MPNGLKTNVKDQNNYSKWSKKSAEKKELETKKTSFSTDTHPPKTIYFVLKPFPNTNTSM